MPPSREHQCPSRRVRCAMQLLEWMPARSRTLLALIVFTTGVLTVVYVLDIQQIDGLRTLRQVRYTRWLEKTWTWSCEEDQCRRHQWRPSQQPGEPRWSSLSTCSMTCGSRRILWPGPTGRVFIGLTSSPLTLPNVKLKIKRASSPDAEASIHEAFDVFRSNLFARVPGAETSRTEGSVRLEVRVLANSATIDLSLNTEEGYKLAVVKKSERLVVAFVTAPTFFGVRHGLETLSQLIWFDEMERGGGSFRVLDNATVHDRPRFGYRGLMVDVARNFIPMSALRRTIDGMAASKLNTLHLHLTDSQSFSFVPKLYPQFSRYGAYSMDKVYTVQDIAELTRFARVRGVRILAEVDTPSHSGNGWQWGETENLGKLAVCVNAQPWRHYCGQPPCGQLNPSNNNTYNILRDIYKDLLEATSTTDLFHMGGDELNANCWMSSADVFPDHQDIVTYQDFWDKVHEFHRRALGEMVAANNGDKPRAVVVWSNAEMPEAEYLRIFPPDTYVLQEWGSSSWENTHIHLGLNYRVVLSHVDAWYFDCGFGPSSPTLNEPCGPVTTLKKVYEHRPWTSYSRKEQSQVLGGEACLWSEKVDEHSIDGRLWPRAAALAERLWTDPEEGEPWEEVHLRISAHRARLVARGLGVSAMGPRWCEENPGEC